MKVHARLCIIVVLISTAGMYAHDVGTHWYISLQTLDIWQDYDLDFYNVHFSQNTCVNLCALKLQSIQRFCLIHFDDAQYFAHQFSLVEALENFC